jgi:CRISPR/Cas system type I-B associated protein Csh2 (Cas7 group RAMP superfamily)
VVELAKGAVAKSTNAAGDALDNNRPKHKYAARISLFLNKRLIWRVIF